VAELAGVSYQTVWRVVNERPNVAEHTRTRVLRAVRELDYHPPRTVEAETTGRSYILQIVTFEHGYGDPLPSLLRWARELGYAAIVTELRDPSSQQAVREILDETGHMVDGLLMVMPYPHLCYERLVDVCHGRPFVVSNTELGAKMPSVVFDQRHGTRLALGHLHALGHRQIAEISGPLENFDARVRHETWQATLREWGLTPGPWVVGDFEVPSGYEAAKQLLRTRQPFTALLAGNDRMALGAIRALRDAGLRVPDDVSVVGFDDVEESAFFDPPLTTVRQDFDMLGRECVNYLVSLIEDPNTPLQQRVLYPELVVRNSAQKCLI